MRHRVRVSVSKQPRESGIITCRSLTIRERLLALLLGEKHSVTVLIPGNTVEEISICHAGKGEEGDE